MELTYTSIAQIHKSKISKRFLILGSIIIAGFFTALYLDNQKYNKQKQYFYEI